MYLGIGRTKMYTLIRDEIPPAKVGRTRRVRRTDLDRFMERRLADRR
jgi:excisionase family DNA binding protein